MSYQKSVRWAFNFNSWNPTEAELLQALGCIQTDEKSRLDKFVFKNDFKASLLGRLMMRKFVQMVTGCTYNKIYFKRDLRGKPVLRDPTSLNELELCFNVAHQGDYTVLAGELGQSTIGVDIMKMELTPPGKNCRDFFRLMSRNFSSNEWHHIRSFQTEQKQINAFYRHWTLKESYVKALGVGITINLQDLNFDCLTPELNAPEIVQNTKLFICDAEQTNWRFEEHLLSNNHCVAVALNSNNRSQPVGFEELNFEMLMANSLPLDESVSQIDSKYCLSYIKKLQKHY